jgi:hypothetical protein
VGREPPPGEIGQGTVEWVGLVLLVSAAVLGLLAAPGSRIPGGSLARAIAERIVCAARLSGACGTGDSALESAYGTEIATLARDHAPRIRYERGMRAVPVDYRRCREDACAQGAPSGQIWRSRTGEPVVAFVHEVDCRAASATRTARGRMDCSGDRAGNLYLQYWFNCKRRDSVSRRVAALCAGAGDSGGDSAVSSRPLSTSYRRLGCSLGCSQQKTRTSRRPKPVRLGVWGGTVLAIPRDFRPPPVPVGEGY